MLTEAEHTLTRELAGAIGDLLDNLAAAGRSRDLLLTAMVAGVVELIIKEAGLEAAGGTERRFQVGPPTHSA